MNNQISYNIPAFLTIPMSSFNKQNTNNKITHARLKMFYIGMTGDKRLFTKTFASKLLKTAPNTPVVAFFDEEEGDFKGHNSTQYVYGYIPEISNATFEKEGEITWAYVDVILFTGREDKIGEVAAKIVGKQHSLELSSESVKYKINKDSSGNFKNFEFLEGSLSGLSVLGDSQTPAFKGSEFFTEMSEPSIQELISQYKDLKNLDLSLITQSNENNFIDGGVKMDDTIIETSNPVQTIENDEAAVENTDSVNVVELDVDGNELTFSQQYKEFALKTYSEEIQEIISAAYEKFGDIYVMFGAVSSDQVVYFERDGYRRVDYKKENDVITFGEPVEVFERFLTAEEISEVFSVKENFTEFSQANLIGTIEGNSISYSRFQPSWTINSTGLVFEEGYTINRLGELNEQEEKPKGMFLSESEARQYEEDRAELQQFREARKIELIESFREFLTEEELEEFRKRTNEGYGVLEKELTFKSFAVLKNKKDNKMDEAVRVFSVPNPSSSQTDVVSLIDKFKDK